MKKIKITHRMFAVINAIIFAIVVIADSTGVAFSYAKEAYLNQIVEESIIEENEKIEKNIPDRVEEYAREHYETYYSLLDDVPYTEDLQLESPYIVCKAGADVTMQAIYHFPISVAGERKAIFTVLDTNDGCTGSISNELAEAFNQFEDMQEYILYEMNGYLYVENAEGACCIVDGDVVEDAECFIGTRDEKEFYNSTMNKKLQQIDNAFTNCEQIDVLSPTPKEDNVKEGYNPTHTKSVDEDTTIIKSTISKYLTPQGYDNICWAASIATIQNYFLGGEVSARSVCDAIGHDYSAATPHDVQQAFNYYSFHYKYTYGDLAWADIKQMIIDNKPLYISGIISDVPDIRHSAVITGVKKVSGVKYIRTYNPQYTGTVEWSEFTRNNGFWTSYTGADTYLWDRGGYYQYPYC